MPPRHRLGERNHPDHGGDRGSPSASVLPARPTHARAHTPVSDEEALAKFTEFVCRYTERLVGYARSGGTDYHLAEDFVQTAHERLWDLWLRTGVMITNFAYSRTIVNRIKIDYYRVAKNTKAIPIEISAEIPMAATFDDEHAFTYTEAFRQAIARLPPRQRQVMELTLFDQLEVPEIAERLNLNPRTVSNFRSLAKKRLVAEFRAMQEE